VAGVPWLAIVGYAAATACRQLIVPLQSVWVNRTIARHGRDPLLETSPADR